MNTRLGETVFIHLLICFLAIIYCRSHLVPSIFHTCASLLRIGRFMESRSPAAYRGRRILSTKRQKSIEVQTRICLFHGSWRWRDNDGPNRVLIVPDKHTKPLGLKVVVFTNRGLSNYVYFCMHHEKWFRCVLWFWNEGKRYETFCRIGFVIWLLRSILIFFHVTTIGRKVLRFVCIQIFFWTTSFMLHCSWWSDGRVSTQWPRLRILPRCGHRRVKTECIATKEK